MPLSDNPENKDMSEVLLETFVEFESSVQRRGSLIEKQQIRILNQQWRLPPHSSEEESKS